MFGIPRLEKVDGAQRRFGVGVKAFQLFDKGGRRVLAGRALVILLSDGLERDSESDLGFQMQRLAMSCDRLIWLNPMLRFAEFEPRATGIRAMLPHVDRFLPAHNLESLAELGRILREGDELRGREAL